MIGDRDIQLILFESGFEILRVGIFLKLQPVFVNIEDESLLYSNVFKFSTFTQGGQIFLVNYKVKHTKVIAVCLVLRKQTRQQMSKHEK